MAFSTPTNRPDQVLVMAIAELAHSAPVAWRDFLKAFDVFVMSTMADCIMAAPDVLPVQQGRARGVNEVHDMLRNAEKTADRMAVRRTT